MGRGCERTDLRAPMRLLATHSACTIHQVGLRALRRVITFIQQDAMLFAGSLRSNLDPFGEHSDAALEAALAEVDWPRLSPYS